MALTILLNLHHALRLYPMPADLFLIATESGMLPVTFNPWDKHTNNWADDCDDWHYQSSVTAEQ